MKPESEQGCCHNRIDGKKDWKTAEEEANFNNLVGVNLNVCHPNENIQ